VSCIAYPNRPNSAALAYGQQSPTPASDCNRSRSAAATPATSAPDQLRRGRASSAQMRSLVRPNVLLISRPFTADIPRNKTDRSLSSNGRWSEWRGFRLRMGDCPAAASANWRMSSRSVDLNCPDDGIARSVGHRLQIRARMSLAGRPAKTATISTIHDKVDEQ
jgi:hypothetical protein